MLTVTKLLPQLPVNNLPQITLSLTAEERTRTRHRFQTLAGQVLLLRLPRGTVLKAGDLLQSETGEIIKIAAKPEPVLTVTAPTNLMLLKAVYHLGNRHVALEITTNYLRCSSDLVLKKMLEQLGVEVKEELVSFQPEIGAYGHKH
ncbi:MAG: urease accessory protein UreE [Gomphosphaeria aponina SAG 52.96 = DSM 107014]|uniref:Urease accessory protein UreE n=1 Tax=Gomphosphaeria aponina SAG 52.96 = DSM 107014 TaxID=1521640 RepID=A0A941JQG1_9CHRO|nr:urease accessory protein UreE [Gomphosphaeria aponina SAG 52.96 = DSM 107014]